MKKLTRKLLLTAGLAMLGVAAQAGSFCTKSADSLELRCGFATPELAGAWAFGVDSKGTMRGLEYFGIVQVWNAPYYYPIAALPQSGPRTNTNLFWSFLRHGTPNEVRAMHVIMWDPNVEVQHDLEE
ncbi:hypothetical protein [Chitinimonas lacunae]|uniref:Uncharacterized protein n=1 Tax=Chitinimonas lacunae TaxID=1963018 RepID=A0ABV8MRT3_9NEIS